MPIKVMTAESVQRMASRALVFGPPNSLKTTAVIATAPYPIQIVSPPGESGWGTIPAGVPGLTSYIWEEPPSDPITASSMKKDVEDTVYQVIAGKHGPCRTLVIDGFHKLYDVYLDVATGGSFGQGEDFAANLYGRAHRMAMRFLRHILASPIEYVIVTTWNAREADIPGVVKGDAHEWPDLPGRMAKLIVGSFSLVVFSKTKTVLGKPGHLQGEWLLKPDVDVWGASVKMDPRLVEKLPAKVPQDWKALFALVQGITKELTDAR